MKLWESEYDKEADELSCSVSSHCHLLAKDHETVVGLSFEWEYPEYLRNERKWHVFRQS